MEKRRQQMIKKDNTHKYKNKKTTRSQNMTNNYKQRGQNKDGQTKHKKGQAGTPPQKEEQERSSNGTKSETWEQNGQKRQNKHNKTLKHV